ncbi:ATP-dependent endonuclease [Bacillus toyonensis]|uniref:ATP-dependent nuclease n=1 Tax=Bacillus toyonensis TaxID=155322 RepID=UPI000BFA4433|nr:AAA family ATPase [Bacillus toyonensis]PEP90532.1 ATP-dependent endonuclease [Bacillus toyonensis]PHC31191.1 ATP-dependent endonuclease [Bacillus toyonensis]
MYISELEVTNFRNFKNANFKFKPGVNTLIGENSSGKSNALYAIRLLLDDTLPINASKFLESDFNQNILNWKGHWIVLKLTFNDLDSSEAASFLAHHSEDITAEQSIGTYALYYRPNKAIRKSLFEFTQQSRPIEELDEILKSITVNDYETVFTCRVNADFNDEQMYKELVGDFEQGIFPNPEEDNANILGNISPHITLIKKEVSCTFVKALRNVIAELKQRKSSPLLKLLRGTANDIEIEEADVIKEQIKTLNKNISELEEIDILTKKIKASLNRTLGYTYSPNVSVKSELPEEMETLLHSLTLWVGDDANSNQGKLDDLSLGGANLIYITLKLLEYEFYQDQEEKAAHFLLIEEPEAHIHTHVQKTLFDKYHFDNTQVIITTHSTHISSASKIDSVNILIKESGFTKVCQPNNGLDSDTCKRIERYLDATRSTLLFAKGVMLVEGDAELILIPAMFKAVFGLSLDEIGVSVINVSSTVFEHIARLFDEQRIHRKCAIITDLDEAIEALPANPEEDNNEQEKMRNSQAAGQIRATLLDATYGLNSWVEVFYAPHTFEIDFALNLNTYEIKASLPSIYKRQSDINSSTKKLNSEDKTIIGKEALRLANKEGKGWFALLVSEKLSYETVIPEYILKAIAFTSEHIRDEHLIAMAKYRIKEMYTHLQVDINKLTLDELIEILLPENDEEREDDFVKLVKLLGVELKEHVH